MNDLLPRHTVMDPQMRTHLASLGLLPALETASAGGAGAGGVAGVPAAGALASPGAAGRKRKTGAAASSSPKGGGGSLGAEEDGPSSSPAKLFARMLRPLRTRGDAEAAIRHRDLLRSLQNPQADKW